MTAALIDGPALEPVTLADVKAHLRLDTDDDDQYLTAAIAAARVHVEVMTRRLLIEQHWRVYLDAWPKKRIVTLSPAPLLAVDTVTIYDADGNPSVLAADDYEADTVAVPGRLILTGSAPVTRSLNGIEIDVTAGYGPSSVDVPAPLRQAINVPPLGFDALIAPYRILSL